MRRLFEALAPLVGFVFYLQSDLVDALERFGHWLGVGGSVAVNTVPVLIGFAILALLRRSVRAALDELGLARSPVRPLLFGLIATAPALIGFALTARTDPEVTLRGVFLLGWYYPWCEEVLFRGLAFGQLYRHARWGFWAASLVPSAVFAAVHVRAGMSAGEIVGIVAITGLGAIVFGYFFVRFGWNLWAAVALHGFLNTWWLVFTVNENALGGASDNVFRFGSIGLAFAIALGAHRVVALRALAPIDGGWRRRRAAGDAA